MNQFPLYSVLNVNLPSKDLTAAQKNNFIKKIPLMDKDGRELIYALIRFYNCENPSPSFYDSIVSKNSVMFDLEHFPIPLKQLLYKFILLHLKKLKEDA